MSHMSLVRLRRHFFHSLLTLWYQDRHICCFFYRMNHSETYCGWNTDETGAQHSTRRLTESYRDCCFFRTSNRQRYHPSLFFVSWKTRRNHSMSIKRRFMLHKRPERMSAWMKAERRVSDLQVKWRRNYLLLDHIMGIWWFFSKFSIDSEQYKARGLQEERQTTTIVPKLEKSHEINALFSKIDFEQWQCYFSLKLCLPVY